MTIGLNGSLLLCYRYFCIASRQITKKLADDGLRNPNGNKYFKSTIEHMLNLQQKKLILEIISEDLTYKDKTLSVKLRPIFDCLSKSSIKLINIEFENNRTLENMIDSGLQGDKTPKTIKNSSKMV
ncbi:MAG: hypothetical protein MJ230_00710 [bacterium]|nr:hypothetical protein [bacterium]